MSASRSHELLGIRILECPAEGPQPRSGHDAIELIGAAASQRASLVLMPAARLGDDFFRLRTRIAGEFIQKFVTYGVRLAVAGDISRYLNESAALRNFVSECNRGSHIWFVADVEDLRRRLTAAADQEMP